MVDNNALKQMLIDNGLSLEPAEVYDLLARIVSAPLPVNNESNWLALITPSPSKVLRSTLLALYDRMKVTMPNDGLGPNQDTNERLNALRIELSKRRLDGFIIPRTDEHNSEYIPRRAERLNWIAGFTGSAGIAVVLQNKAALFVDGRYLLQASIEIDGSLFENYHISRVSLAEWFAAHTTPEQCIGYDPWLHTPDDLLQLEEVTKYAQLKLISCDTNPIDAVWHSQPLLPIAPVVPHPIFYTGYSEAEKRRAIAFSLTQANVDATVLVALDSIAWLLNIRGGDVPYAPLTLAFAILYANARVDLFLDSRKLTQATVSYMNQGTRVFSPETFEISLDTLGQHGKRICLDMASTPVAIVNRLRAAGAYITSAPNPCILLQACKNEAELSGLRIAHRRDGIVLVQFLRWLEMAITNGCLITEQVAADQLETLRRKDAYFRGSSFATISAYGPNSAIIHYHATRDTNCRLQPDNLYLIDSGAQYLDGTTDVTRTISIGSPVAETRRRFTQVLKGHIALATAVFPIGTTGSQLDILARQALWADGVDYDHGTGHGVGCYLNVHEGPHSITALSNTPLIPGMVISDEPGYYKAGAYGIRIENLLTVRPVAPLPADAERSLLTFDVLTLVPIDKTLIEPTLLSLSEQAWINAYHDRIRVILTPLLDSESAIWLIKRTKPLDTS